MDVSNLPAIRISAKGVTIMSDWFNNTPTEGSGGESGGTPVSGDAGTPSSGGQETTGWSSPASNEGSSASPYGNTGAPYSSWPSGSSSPASSDNGPSSYDSDSSPSTGSGWQSGQNPAPQRPAPAYNPYGWQPPVYPSSPMPTPGGPQKPPKKKKSPTNILIGVLGGLCAVTIITLSVLLAMAWDGGIDSPATSGGGTGSPNSSVHNGDAPKLQINELDENAEGLSTRDIVKKNLESTVILSIYDGQGSYGMGEQQSGEASGIVMTSDGYIITNWHCVVNEDTGKEYSRIAVTMHDGTVYDHAEIVGYDKSTDLAVIRVAAMNLTPAEFGDSSQLDIGDKVVALGNAGGLAWTATQGIVSGLARDVYEDTGYAIKCLQVDAAINPGNSGGPLMNAAGQVIAVNSAKIAITGYEGLGFSIPITEAREIINDLIEYGYVTGRVSLGIRGYTINQSNYKGFLIDSIVSGSPLEGTGAQKGDLITHVDGVRVNSYGELRAELSKRSVGDTVTLTILRVENRRDSTFTVQVKLAEDKGQ